MNHNIRWSIIVFAVLLVLTWVISGGRFVFSLFIFPLGLLGFWKKQDQDPK